MGLLRKLPTFVFVIFKLAWCIRGVMRTIIPLLVLCLLSCTDAENSTRILKDEGYTKIEITGYGWFGCSSDDTYSTEFAATSVSGSRVTGVVCCGVFAKGCTIRRY